MVLYSLILFFAAVPMIIISISIYKGNTNLIHDYHQTNVTDKVAYGKAFGKGMFVIAIALLLSGIIGLLNNLAMLAVVVLITGLCVGVGCIVAVQRKYNKGVF